MNTKLTLALAAAMMATAPAAYAQVTSKTMNSTNYEQSSPSGLPSVSPQVQSLPGYNDTWSRNDSWSRPSNYREGQAGTTGALGTSGATAAPAAGYPSYGVTGGGPVGTKTYGTTDTVGATSGAGGTVDMPSTGTTTMGATSGTSGMTGVTGTGQAMSNLPTDDPAARRGRGQNNLELSQTTLLNQFSAAGYAQVRDFRKQGDNYIAEAMTPMGVWSTVQLEPSTGRITTVR